MRYPRAHNCWLFLRAGSCTLLRNLEQPRDVDPEVKGRLQGLLRSGLGAKQIHHQRVVDAELSTDVIGLRSGWSGS